MNDRREKLCTGGRVIMELSSTHNAKVNSGFHQSTTSRILYEGGRSREMTLTLRKHQLKPRTCNIITNSMSRRRSSSSSCAIFRRGALPPPNCGLAAIGSRVISYQTYKLSSTSIHMFSAYDATFPRSRNGYRFYWISQNTRNT